MNHVFRVVWNSSANTFVAVCEHAKARGKGRNANRQKKVSKIVVMLSLCMAVPHLSAAIRYWDVNGTGVGLGGSGIWNTASAPWSGNGDGVSGPFIPWSNSGFDDANFSGTAGTVTLGLPINIQNLTFQTTGYTLNGSTLTLGGVTPTITAAPSVTAIINSAIAGAVGLIKSGSGTLSLNGVNTFSGGITVGAGRLTVNGNAALGALSNGISMANGTALQSSGALPASREVTLGGGAVTISGAGVGSAHFIGAGGLTASAGVSLTNDANTYAGQTRFGVQDGNYSFTSIADLGVASSLGAPTTVANGTVFFGSGGGSLTTLSYIGTGGSSNRNWQIQPNGPSAPVQFRNGGTGALTLTGSIALVGGSMNLGAFNADTADLHLLGVITSNNNRPVNYSGGGSARTITLGGANTYAGNSAISGVTVQASELANTGVASSFGTGTAGGIAISGSGVLSYTGIGGSSNRSLTLNNGTINNNGSGGLTLGGGLALTNNFTLGGNFAGADNHVTGVISGSGNLAKSGTTTWVLDGGNTYSGTTTVNDGTLRAGSTQAFGALAGAVVNGGALDLNGLDTTFTSLGGTGGSVVLGSALLTVDAPAGINTSYAGIISGTGGLIKQGASTLVLTGANTYTGATTVNGGALGLNFASAGAPISNIVSSASTLNMGGGALNVNGGGGTGTTQTFNGLNVTGGNNTFNATSGAGGSATVNFGAITHNGGLINFGLPVSGNLTTTNASLGGWATVNGTDYAKVVAGNIRAFTLSDYSPKDNAANWLANEFITDTTGFFGTLGSSLQLGGLRYTRPVATTVTIAGGQTLGVDGTIIVAPTVGTNNQLVTGGTITGTQGGGSLGIQQNSAGNFTIGSLISDNSGSVGFAKAGTGLVTLTNINTYTGGTLVSQGMLSVGNIGNGGVASGIGASPANPSNLMLEGGTLRYTGASTSSDRGFTLAKAGAILSGGVEVNNASSSLSFSGLVTSSDGAGLVKTGPGTLTLSNGGNNYAGVTTVNGGTLSVNTLANGGQVSGIGASTSASSNLILDGGELEYTGATASSNRGFTIGNNDGAIDVSNAASTLTLSGAAVLAPTPVGTVATLTKQGAGTLVLSGINTYNGGTVINAGTLRAGSTQAFGVGGVTLANTTGTALDLNGFNNTVGFLSGGGASGGNVTLGSSTLTLNGASASYAGSISGTGGLMRTGGVNTQVLAGCNNSYTGVTTISGSGAVSVDCLADGGVNSGIGASSNAASNLVLTSGVLAYTGGTVNTNRGMTLGGGAGAIQVNNAATTLMFSGPVVGGGQLSKRGPGTLVLSGINTYTGNTSVEAGTLRAGSTQAFGTGGINLINSAGTAIDLAGFNETARYLSGGGATGGNVSLGAGTLSINEGLNQIYGGAISGSGGLVKSGTGNQTLSGCNSSYSGSTAINGGMLSVNCLNNGGSNSSIGSSGVLASNLVINGGTLQYLGAGSSSDRLFTLGASGGTLEASGSGPLQLTNSGPMGLAGINAARTLSLAGSNANNNTFSALLTNNGTGALSMTKSGGGTWVLANANNTYTGATNIGGGVLSVTDLADGGFASSIGASSVAASNLVIGNGSTLRYVGSGDSTDRLFTLAPGVTFIESSGTGAINFSNTGAVTLSGTNTARTIALGGTNTGMNTLGGTIADNGTGATTLAKNDSGSWALTGNNTFTGNTVINNGNLMIGNGGNTGNAGGGNVIIDSATSTLSLNRGNDFVVGGTLSGPGTLAQIGAGTATLTSANNVVGATVISAGTLEVSGSLSTPSLAMTGTSTLAVLGTVQAVGGATTVLNGDAGNNTIEVGAAGELIAHGDMGDGSDALNLTGILHTGSFGLSLGAGDDSLTFYDGAQYGGLGIDGGSEVGTDILRVDNAVSGSFDAADVSGFEEFQKTNTGVLTLTSTQIYTSSTFVGDGTLEVAGTLETPLVLLADDTTLDVSGTVDGGAGTTTLLLGSTGVNDVRVSSGGILRVNGDLDDGDDTLFVAGLLDTSGSALELGAGDDTLTLEDGALIEGPGVDAGSAVNSDVLILNNALALTFDGAQTSNFEQLLKLNAGVASMTGSQAFADEVSIVEGALNVDGDMETAAISLFDDTALTVNGTVQGGAGSTSAVFGSAGSNLLTVNGSAAINGDLGAGNDVLDVGGNLSTGSGILDLGDDDDTLTIHDDTVIDGTVAGGAGNDVFNTDIATTAQLGAVQGFETLFKTGVGVLGINGPLDSDFTQVQVMDGTLDITGGGVVTAAPGSELLTVVGAGALLNVDGSYGCGAGNDRMDVSGTVAGGGVVDLCGGDDILTVNDGAVLSMAVSGGAGLDDVLLLNNAAALNIDVGNTTQFERLQKDLRGEATLTGNQAFSGGTTVLGGALIVAGQLETPTIDMADDTQLQIEGLAQAAGAPLQLNGSTGRNAVTVGAGGTLRAVGDLGLGDDLLDVFGTLDAGVGGNLLLGDGDDTFVVHDGTTVIGTVSGGNGVDTQVYDLAGSANVDAVVEFEGLTKRGLGTLHLTGPATSELSAVVVEAGILDVQAAASVVAQPGNALMTEVRSGATLNVDGSWTGSALSDGLDIAGTVSGSGTIDLADGNDTLTLHDGADLGALINAIDGGSGSDLLLADIAGTATLGGADNFELLTKTNLGTLNIDGPSTSSFTTVAVQGGTLNVSPQGSVVGVVDTTIDAGARLNVDGVFHGSGGDDRMTVAGALSGNGSLDLEDGDDVLTLNDGADLSGLSSALDGGLGAGDQVVLSNASDLTLGASLINFETLYKDNSGVATLAGTQSFSGGATINAGELKIDGALITPVITFSNTTDTTTLTVSGDAGASASTPMLLAGSSGANAVVVDSAGTLRAVGDLGAGDDLLDVLGILDAGVGGNLLLGDGDDTFVVHDGTTVIGTVIGGNGVDTQVYDLAGSANVDAVVEFEGLTKRGLGTLHLTGPATSELSAVVVEAGVLDVQAAASVVAQPGNALMTEVRSGATLNVDGSWTGSALSDGLDIAGTVSGSGTIDLADGDDTLTLHDGADLGALTNAIDGGSGSDLLLADIAGTATLGGADNFELLTKTNLGTLNIDGPSTSSFTTVAVQGGTLNVSPQGSVVGVVDTTIDAGARLNVDGVFHGSGGDDRMTVAGALSGSGSLDLEDGDDVLTFNDGADLSGLSSALDGGLGTGDQVVLNNASDLSLGASLINFETLYKDNTGVATLAGAQTLSGGTTINAGELKIDGALNTPIITFSNTTDTTTLTVSGDAGAAGSTPMLLTGSSGANVVVVNSGGTLRATGDLAQGDDTLDVAGTLDAGLSGSVTLGDGDDTLILHDNSTIIGAVNGGAGIDTRVYDLAGTAAVGALTQFEALTKRGGGVLNVTGPGTSELVAVTVENGSLTIESGSTVVAQTGNALNATVWNGATLAVDGAWTGSDQGDRMDIAGTLTCSGVLYLGAGDDTLILHDGADLSGLVNPLDGGTHTPAGDSVVMHVASQLTMDASAIINFEQLEKQGAGTVTLTGAQTWNHVALNDGALALGAAGAPSHMKTDTLAMFDNTQFALATGSMAEGHTGPAIAITGSAGVNTVSVQEGASLAATGRLGDGDDTLDVAGTLNIAGDFNLGAGDDTFKVYDTTVVTGTLDAGAGNDTLNTNVSATRTAVLGGLDGFESLDKSGAGTLHLTGSSAFINTTISEGTLKVMDEVVTNTLNLVNGATLALADGRLAGTAGADIFQLAGRVEGTGSLDLREGDDTLIVQDGADFSTFNGVVDAGVGSDTLEADIATLATLATTTNIEALNKTGGGTLTLGGSEVSDFSTVNINAGTLAVSSGSAVAAPDGGTLQTQIVQGATLAVDGAYGCGDGNDSLDVSGAIRGSGVIDLCGGDDTMTLNSGADLTAMTGHIDGGTNGSEGDTLVLNSAESLTLSGDTISGFEVLHKMNSGDVTLTGSQTYARATLIGEGQMKVEGRLTSATVEVGTEATLSGAGTIVGDVVNAGTLSPGGSVGTLSVEGDVSFAPSSIFSVEVEPAGGSDRLNVSGVVTIAGGTVDVLSAAGAYEPGNRWTLISAAGGVTGAFDRTLFSLPFLNLSLGYDPSTVFLEVERNDTAFPDLAVSSNQASLARGLQSLSNDSPLFRSVLNLPDTEAVRNAYNQLSGELHSSLFGTLLDDSRLIRQATLNRTCLAQQEQYDERNKDDRRLSTCSSQAQDHFGNVTIWGQAIGTYGTTDSTSNTAEVKRDVTGLYLGGDLPATDNWRVGLVTGYEKRSVDVSERQSSADVHSYHVGGYANAVFGAVGVHLGAVHTQHAIDSKRQVNLAGNRQSLKADYDVATNQVFAELSYKVRMPGMEMEPFAGLAYVHQGGNDSFNETGGTAALSGEDTEEHLTYSTTGVRAAAQIGRVGSATVLATGSLAWQRLLDDNTPDRTFRLAGSSAFNIEGAPIGRDSIPVEAGVAIDFKSDARLSVGYRGHFSSGYADHGVTVALSVPF
ncbi:autotransporter-associated beta strand repeat-containing protein [Pseudomonas sp. NPDC098747]|uniref:autotransporter-associated beta strand repeat-containing protein n=1 Tax=Pseudomonas sp. NPDC098747 TaxID=3364487 RepID=UPI00383A7207